MKASKQERKTNRATNQRSNQPSNQATNRSNKQAGKLANEQTNTQTCKHPPFIPSLSVSLSLTFKNISVSVSFFLSLSLSLSLSVSQCVCKSVSVLSVFLSLSLSLPLPLSVCVSVSICLVSNICKTVSKNIFLMSQLKRYVSPQTLKIFYSSHILPHISFSSTVWDGCGETHLNKLNSLHRRAAKLLLPDKNSSTDEKKRKPLAYYRYRNNCTLIRQY